MTPLHVAGCERVWKAVPLRAALVRQYQFPGHMNTNILRPHDALSKTEFWLVWLVYLQDTDMKREKSYLKLSLEPDHQNPAGSFCTLPFLLRSIFMYFEHCTGWSRGWCQIFNIMVWVMPSCSCSLLRSQCDGNVQVVLLFAHVWPFYCPF